MAHITKLAVIETTSAIWENDPSELNHVLSGSLDIIATIRTLAIKVCGLTLCMHVALTRLMA